MTEQKHQRFDSKADEYERGRPGYPDSALRFLIEEMKLDSSMTLADVGAGTGILTRAMKKHIPNVIAIEPNDEMRERIDSSAVRGTAEDTGLPTESINAIFAAQAFHWFDSNKSRSEFKRILKAPRQVALLWNEREASDNDGLIRLNDLMRSLRKEPSQRLEADELAIKAFFETSHLNTAEFANPMRLTRDEFLSMVLSRSYAPRRGTVEYTALVNQLTTLFDDHAKQDRFTLPYRTKVYWGRL